MNGDVSVSKMWLNFMDKLLYLLPVERSCIFLLPVGVFHIMRCINARYLLTDCFRASETRSKDAWSSHVFW